MQGQGGNWRVCVSKWRWSYLVAVALGTANPMWSLSMLFDICCSQSEETGACDLLDSCVPPALVFSSACGQRWAHWVRLVEARSMECSTAMLDAWSMARNGLFEGRKGLPAKSCPYHVAWLVALARLDPILRDRCSDTLITLCFSGYRKLSLLYPLLGPPKEAYRNKKDSAKEGYCIFVRASSGYRTIGGIAWDRIANRKIVGH